MDVVDLRLFINVQMTGSLTSGAERTNLSLPAASARIRQLENRYGVQFLYRTNQGVRLTEAGETFLDTAGTILTEVGKLEATLRDMAQGAAGRIRICSSRTPTREFLPSIIREFLLKHPNVNVQIEISRNSADIVKAVNSGNADLGIYSKEMPIDGLQSFPYKKDRFVLAVPPRHPLAGRSSIAFEDTIDYDYVGIQGDIAIHGFLLATAAQLNKHLRVRVYVSGLEAMLRLIEGDVGIGILPATFVARHLPPAQMLELQNDWAVRAWRICMRDADSLPPYARDFLDLMLAGATV